MQKRKLIIIIISIILAITIASGSIYVFGFYLPNKKKQEEAKNFFKVYYESKVASYQEENEKFDDYEVDTAFIGDSLTDGYDLTKYYPDLVTANRGIGGDTTFGLEARLKVSVYDLKPKVVAMLIGANNLDTMFQNYENILTGLKDNLPETKVVLLSLTAMGGSWGHNNQLATYNNVKIKKLAEKYGFSFVDLYTPLFNENLGEIYPEYTTDGGHLTPLGYEVFTSALYPTLKILLNK